MRGPIMSNLAAKLFTSASCCLLLALLPTDFATAADTASTDKPKWLVLANCAAGYLGNWQSRREDPDRSAEMGAMILDLSNEYKVAAVRRHREQMQSSQQAAEQAVSDHINSAVAGFVAMDKKDELIPFLDACPQIDSSE